MKSDRSIGGSRIEASFPLTGAVFVLKILNHSDVTKKSVELLVSAKNIMMSPNDS